MTDEISSLILGTPQPKSAKSNIRYAADLNNPSGYGYDGKTWKSYETPEEGVNETMNAIQQKITTKGFNTPEKLAGNWVTGDATQNPQNGKYAENIRKELFSIGLKLNPDGSIPNSPDAIQAVTRAIIKNETAKQHQDKFLNVLDAPKDEVSALIMGTPLPKKPTVDATQQVNQPTTQPATQPTTDQTSAFIGYPTLTRQAQNAAPSQARPALEQTGKDLTNPAFVAKDLAALFDNTVGSVLPFFTKKITQAGTRFLGAEQAAEISDKLVSYVDKPLGRAFGITNDPVYQNQALGKIMEFIGENKDKGDEWIAKNLDMNKNDVQFFTDMALIKAGQEPTKFIKKPLEAVGNVATSLQEAIGEMKKRKDTTGTVTLEGVNYQPETSKVNVFKTEENIQQLRQKADELNKDVINPDSGLEGQALLKRAEEVRSLREEASRLESTIQPNMVGVGAAKTQNATVLKQAIATASPELSEALKKLDPNKIDLDVLARRVEADSLPIPLQYTKGQATGDPVLISQELNSRGKVPKLAEIFNQQNKILQENASVMKDKVAPDVFTESHVADAQGLISNIETKAKNNAKATKQAYLDLKNAAGGQFPVDGKQFADNAINILKLEDRFDYLPFNIQRKLNDYQTGKKDMNFNLFENLRTDLAAEIRKAQRAGDGNQAYVLGQVRGELEKLPMLSETAELKILADKARSIAKANFDLEKQNKIYSDVVNDKADTKNFISKNVINSTNKDFANTIALVADDVIAKQHLASGTLDLIIKDSTDASGNFLTGKFAKHINNLELNNKLVPLFGKEAATLVKIANASKIVGARPKGSFVNESNTLVGAMSEYAKSAAEHGTNVAFSGLPVGTISRKLLNKRTENKELKETLSPTSGIQLKDIGK